jgi:hypothetical protein
VYLAALVHAAAMAVDVRKADGYGAQAVAEPAQCKAESALHIGAQRVAHFDAAFANLNLHPGPPSFGQFQTPAEAPPIRRSQTAQTPCQPHLTKIDFEAVLETTVALSSRFEG